jgi:CheY-like chemotaxis protein
MLHLIGAGVAIVSATAKRPTVRVDTLDMLPTEPQCSETVAVLLPGPCVLIVDDDPDFRVLAGRLLEAAGFRVIEADTVADGLSRLRPEKVALMVLDIVMPDRDGIEGMLAIKSMCPVVRVLTMSRTRNSKLYLKVTSRLGADA